MLEKINFGYGESDDQTDLFTKGHTKFDCFIEYDNHAYGFNYQCNTAYTDVKKEDCISSLILDANAYEDYNDIGEFLYEFGYTDNPKSISKGIKAYNACKDTFEMMHKIFSDEEYTILCNELGEF